MALFQPCHRSDLLIFYPQDGRKKENKRKLYGQADHEGVEETYRRIPKT